MQGKQRRKQKNRAAKLFGKTPAKSSERLYSLAALLVNVCTD
jgi:hypothetical protein